MDNNLELARQRIRAARHIVAFTGAGMSAESGLATFRGPSGLWEGVRPEDLATPAAFRRDPQRVWRWYNWRRSELAKALPNAGHLAIADAGRRMRVSVITQNVDRLHQAAGSEDVIELHGNLKEANCTECGLVVYKGDQILDDAPTCDACDGLLRPSIVWFGEQLPHDALARAWLMVTTCDVMLVIGTSGVVHPAAGLVHDAQRTGAFIIEINTLPTGYSKLADLAFHAPCGQVLPLLLRDHSE